MEQVRTIRLYGPLGVRFGRVHRMAVSSAAEAVHALGCQLEGFDAYLIGSKDRGVGYSVFYGKKNLKEDQFFNPVGSNDIRIAPMILGSKNGGFFSIVLGAVLVVAATLIGGPGAGAFALKIAAGLTTMGYSLIIGGIVQLLTPTPKGRSAKDRPDNQPSLSFNGPINTQAQGNPVAVLYGELIVGSAVLSAGIIAKDHAIIPTTTTPAGSGGGGGGLFPTWNGTWITLQP